MCINYIFTKKQTCMKYILTFILLLLSNFYGLTTFPIMLLLILMLIYCKQCILSPPKYAKKIFYFTLFVAISSIPAYLFRGQPILASLRASTGYFLIFIFFLFLKLKINKQTTEKTIIIFGTLTSTIYIIQFILLQKGIVFLQVQENAIELATDARFRIACSASIFLAYFCALNKYLIYKNKKYLIILFITFLPIIIQAFRAQIAALIVFTIIMIYIFWKKGLFKINKIIFILVPSVFLLLQIPIVNEKLEYMIDKQTNSTQTFANDDYVRWRTLSFFSSEYQKSPVEYIVGSGIPYQGSFKKESENLTAEGLFYQDIGLIGAAFIIGPISIICLVCLFLTPTFIIKNSNLENLYICIYFIFMLSISFTNAEVFRSGNFLIHAIAFYVSYLCYKEKKYYNYYARKRITTV